MGYSGSVHRHGLNVSGSGNISGSLEIALFCTVSVEESSYKRGTYHSRGCIVLPLGMW